MRSRLALAVLGLVAAAPALALDLPARKPGLWEIKMSFDGRNTPPVVAQHCIDAATDKLMNAMGNETSGQMCSRQDMQRNGSTIVVDSVCKIAGATTNSHGVITGDFNSAYTVKVSTRREGGGAVAQAIPAQTSMTIDARWAGPCQGDQKPGDMIMPGGIKVNVLKMQKMMGAISGGQQKP